VLSDLVRTNTLRVSQVTPSSFLATRLNYTLGRPSVSFPLGQDGVRRFLAALRQIQW
jgi:hypothetical protein